MFECGKTGGNRFDGHFHTISKRDRSKCVCHVKPDNASARRRYAVNEQDGLFVLSAADHDRLSASQVNERDRDTALSDVALNIWVRRIEAKQDSSIGRKIARNLQAVCILSIQDDSTTCAL